MFNLDTVNVTITPMDWEIDTIITGPAHCGVNDGYVSLMLDGNPSPPSYNWTGPGANNPSFVNASVWSDLAAGWYYATVTVDGCSRYDSIEVVIEDGPQAIGSANPSSGTAPLDVTFTNSSTNASNYFWDFGNTNTANVGDLSDQNQTYTDPGTYTIMLVANSSNCSDTTYLTVIVEEPPVPPVDVIVNIPNVFTPNNDAVNDYFEVDIQNAITFDVEIRNRWGNVMYKSDDVMFQWDGTTKGAPANTGVYFYYINLEDQQGEMLHYNGTVHLKR